jgi:hypothetical protein
MKKIAFVLFLFALMASNAHAISGKAAIGAVSLNPASSAVLATTGSLSSGCSSGNGGNYIVEVFVSSTVPAVFDFQTLSGGSPVAHIYIMTPATGSATFAPPISFAVVDGLTLSLVNVSALVGTAQANLFWTVASCN